MTMLPQAFLPLSLIIFFSCSHVAPASASASSTAQKRTEVEALLNWKATLQNQTQSYLSAWTLSVGNTSSSASSPCSWTGIRCNHEGSVIRINLTSIGLRGTLDYLNFTRLPNLSTLDLHDNSLFGEIPSRIISNLSQLTVLNLGFNQFTGNMPPEVGSLMNLKVLSFSNNLLSGSIPPNIGNLTNLSFLYLANNHLSGSIPPELGMLKSLTELRLNLNNLTGSIPASLGDLVGLKVLSLYGNQLSGPLPSEINNLTNLTLFFLSNNSISGFLPENICHGGILEDFCASNNRFTGLVPKGLRNCTSLTRLRLDRNNLVGNISEDFGVYPNLDYIDLSYNNFHGEISPNWGKCQLLTSLKISNNQITGEMPPELGETSRLHVLDLSSNNLVGRIPYELGNLKSLFNLTLSMNNLSGTIPPEIGYLPDLAYLDLAANNLSGPIPRQLGDCSKMLFLNLSRNNFLQGIPIEIGNLFSLQVLLDLSRNSLTEEIPWQLGQLVKLEILDLSHNQLNGSIPSSFNEMQSLRLVDFSYNRLEGPIPDNKAFEEAQNEAFRNNRGLCGNHTGLTSCHPPLKDAKQSKVAVLIIVVPIPAAVFFLTVIVGMLFVLKKGRKKESNELRDDSSRHGNLFAIWRYDGNLVFEDIKEATESFDAKYCIGEGATGTVYKAELSSGQVVAVKKLQCSQMEDRKSYESEIRALTKIRHRNIVKLHGFCSQAQRSFLIYEYLERGSIAKILSSVGQSKELDWMKRINIVKGVANALDYMHHNCSPPIIHRDISSNNILLDANHEAHVSDFGTARLVKLDSSNWTGLAGTYGYIAPGNLILSFHLRVMLFFTFNFYTTYVACFK
jgi:Leucine-rich repeat (LRR) protein/tRNA A-37 threonylcarbamoyl transferase component Bud32